MALKMFKPVIFVFFLIFLIFSQVFSAADTNSNTIPGPAINGTNSNSIISTNNITITNQNDNNQSDQGGAASGVPGKITFDSYDEVIMQNYEKDNITHIKFLGNVKIHFDDNVLKARRVIVTSASNTVLDLSAFDKVEFKYGGSTYLADFMSFNPNTKKGVLKNVRTFIEGSSSGAGAISGAGTKSSGNFGGWYIFAKKAVILANDKVVLEGVTATWSPDEYPQYYFGTQRMWYFKNDLIFAFSDKYTVGQADFIWFPYFMRWERFTGLKTAFGQEKRIGWYLMNSISLGDPLGTYDYGLDIYERLGQYFYFNFSNKKDIGVFNKLTFSFKTANDTRVTLQNDRYMDLVNDNGTWTNIQQIGWDYKINGSIQTNNMSINFNWEDLNDPFFQPKYASRLTEFDFQKVIQPFNNTFYSQNDTIPSVGQSVYNRSFSFSSYGLSISGQWNYSIYVDPSVSNQYLNDRYKYYVSSVALPNISYTVQNPIDIFKIKYSVPVNMIYSNSSTNFTVPLGTPYNTNWGNLNETNSNTNGSMSNTNSLLTNSNFSNQLARGPVNTNTNSALSLPWAVTNSNYKTNEFVLFDYTSTINGINISYSPSENYNQTNNVPYLTSDAFLHKEGFNYSINGNLLNSLLQNSYTFSVNNEKHWSTTGPTDVNNINQSGAEINLSANLNYGQNYSYWTNTLWETTLSPSAGQNITYNLFRTKDPLNPRTASYTTSASFSINTLNDFVKYKNLGMSLALSHSMSYRLTNITGDNYLNNMTLETFSINPTLRVWWLNFSTGSLQLNILSTSNTNFFDQITHSFYDTFTNRLSGGSLRLSVSLAPPAEYKPLLSALYIPDFSVNYVYDVLTHSNVSFNLTIPEYSFKEITSPFLYRLELLSFTGINLNWDFQNPMASFFQFGFSTKIWFDMNWLLEFSTSVLNNKLYLYDKELANKYGGTNKAFFDDLLQSLNVFDYNGLKKGNFKIHDLNFVLHHYINEWELRTTFSIKRQLDSQYQLFYYWEPTLMVEFILSQSGDQFFPKYQRDFVPSKYQSSGGY